MKNILLIISLLLVIVLALKGCVEKISHTSLLEQYESLRNDANLLSSEVEKERDKNDILVAKVSSFVTESEELEKKLRDERLTKLKSKVEFQTVIQYDTILMNVHDTILVQNGDTISKRFFKHTDKWFSLQGEVHKDIVSINKMVIHDSLDVQFGQEKDGLFKKKNVVIIKSANPNSDLTNIRPYEFKEKKKWYEKDGWKIIATAVLTSFIILSI